MKSLIKYFEKAYKAILVFVSSFALYYIIIHGTELPQWVAILGGLSIAAVNTYVLFTDLLNVDIFTPMPEKISFEDANGTTQSRIKYLVFKVINLIFRCLANFIISFIAVGMALFA